MQPWTTRPGQARPGYLSCGHRQHALDMHDRDILPHSIGWRPCQPTRTSKTRTSVMRP